METKIDIDTWPRKAQYEFFRTMDYPHFNICANVDITKFYAYIKSKSLSFYTTMIYITTKAANEIPEFRYRLRGDEIIEHDIVHPSFIIMGQPEVFSFCAVSYSENLEAFTAAVNDRVEALKNTINLVNEQERDDMLYITSMPWVSFTSLSHPINIKSVDSIPRIAFGKYFKEQDLLKMPLSVQVNHILMDGIHVGKFYEIIQEMLDHPEESLCL
ncbi:chloramphenicol acetyltransferase [Fusibacter ferrireducens]|uniref:Chloramphenicol acetyltransferase n=1 Tax=Fusibacter ferrireducens TaxID=2785058 RepID=A0ABR9ZNG6_9FIRM|nr:chloramphenicol acetyltransferase [Fusibacter ferrireducens]MBF4691979.1 chloramphenicol acetyltransferase [Fusibacter ferrireducens]